MLSILYISSQKHKKKMVLIKITTTCIIHDFQRLYFSFNSTIINLNMHASTWKKMSPLWLRRERERDVCSLCIKTGTRTLRHWILLQ